MNPSVWARRRVFVTGGTGLLGAHLTRQLVELGAEVIALVRDVPHRSLFFDPSPEWSLNGKVITVRGDIEDLRTMQRIQSEYEIDTVFHLAAQTIVGCANQDPVGTFKANIEGTWNVLEAARHNPRLKAVIIASSDKAYGNLHGSAYDETFPLHGEHPYDVSKSCADLISQTYAKSYGLPVAITRCGNFFGPGDLNYSRIIPGVIRDVMLNRRPVIRSDGKAIRDYIYVGDGVHAYITLAEALLDPNKGKSLVGEGFNFSYGLRLSVLDVMNSVLKIMERTDLKPDILNQAKNEIPEQSLDSKKAKEVLNWSQKYGFEEGLKNTIAWYRKEIQSTGKVAQ